MVPFSRDNLFVGREDIIAKVSEHRAAASSHTRIAFVGLGGVGSVLVYSLFLDSSINRLLGSRKSR